VGRRAVSGEDEQAGRPLFFGALLAEDLGALEPYKSKLTRLQWVVHSLRKFRGSGTLRCHDGRYSEHWRTEEGERALLIRPNTAPITRCSSQSETKKESDSIGCFAQV
jgi:hypothetical protein